ncbi:Alpha/Beta hydrolase fold [Fusarium oxysporum f. sp. vasinfectum]|nr:Alpha/Beta hydrolase fold [Fusarium oxysporum f. sp. vasinfectum]
MFRKLLPLSFPPQQQGASPQNFLEVLFEGESPEIDIVAVTRPEPARPPKSGKDYVDNWREIMVEGLSAGSNSSLAGNDVPDRPVIFVCHSLGGLVVKRALSTSRGDSTYCSIFDSTFGVVFFGTPHHGGNGAGLGAIAASITRAVLGNPSNSFLEALTQDSNFLSIITDDFSQLLEKLYFISFFETRPLGKTRQIVVDRASATLGLGREREKQIGLDADHARICKFSQADDPMYQQVEDNIAEIVNAAISKRKQKNENPDKRLHNVTQIRGNNNKIAQHGRSNSSLVTGDVNHTQQYGDDNKTSIEGGGNVAMQISSNEYYGLWETLRGYFVNQPVGPWMNNQPLENSPEAR